MEARCRLLLSPGLSLGTNTGEVLVERATGIRGIPLSSVTLSSATSGEPSAHADGAAQHRVAGRWKATDAIACHSEDVVCITLYNEAAASLHASLRSVLSSACRARAAGMSRSLCICILADGVEHESRCVTQYLVAYGLLSPCIEVIPNSEVDFHHSTHSVTQWVTASAGSSAASSTDSDNWQVNFIVCRKRSNMGKMHSHALFFGQLCPLLAPQRCWQIDAGTLVNELAMTEMIRCLSRDDMAAAVGARIEVSAPGDDDSFVKRWQYMDFSVQLATLWPSEVAAGHMSVVPGQFCMFRWAALSAPGRDGAQAPVERYLRGLSPSSAMERIMFLAEDRVVGNELVLNGDRPWRIAYCAGGGALTDACETLQELTRQRRRWNNCSFACRLWLLGSWPKQILRRDRDLHHKLHFTSGTLWQGLLVTLQCMTPAFAVSRWFMWWAALTLAWQSGYQRTVLATAGMVLASLLLSMRKPSVSTVWNRRVGAIRDATAMLTLTLLTGCMLLVASPWLVALLMLPSILAAALPLIVGNANIVSRWHYSRHIPEYVMFEGLFQSYLWGYALCHLGDTSWGTKGLTQSLLRHTRATRGSKQAKSTYELAIWSAFLIANGLCLYVLIGLHGVAAAPSNPVSECAAILMSVVVLVALLGHRRLEMGSKWV